MTEKSIASLPEPITRAATLLSENYDGRLPSMRQIDFAVSSGRWPVVRVNGRRFFNPADLPALAALFGLTPKAKAPAKAARKAPAVSVPVAA